MARATARNLQAPILSRLDPSQPLGADANGAFVRAALATLPRSARNAMFDRLDANKDGSISRAEFDAPRAQGQRAGRGERGQRGPRAEHAGRGHGGMHRGAQRMGRNGEGRFSIVIAEAEQRATASFTRLDANHDGALTAEERRAGMQARRAELREKRQERREQRAAPAASPSTPASE